MAHCLETLFLNTEYKIRNICLFKCRAYSKKGPYIYDVHTHGYWRGFEIFHLSADSFVFKKIDLLFIFADGSGGR